MSPEVAMVGAVIVPLLAGVLAFMDGARRAVPLALLVAGFELTATAVLVSRMVRDGPLRVSLGGVGAPLGIDLYVDGLGVVMMGATAIVGTFVTLYAIGWFPAAAPGEPPGPGVAFWPLWLVLWAALDALFLSADIFNLYVTLELVTVASVASVGLAGGRGPVVAALRYLLWALVGSLLYLMGVALLYGTYGVLDWAALGRLVEPDLASGAGVSLMVVGLLLKMAVFPLHPWLPPAHSHAPAPVSAILSGLVLKAPFFILLRLWSEALVGIASPWLPDLLGLLCAGSILWGSVQALRQARAKLVVAYSTVAQVGYLLLIFPLAGTDQAQVAWRGVAYLALTHAVAKAAAFLAVGTLARVAGSDELSRWEGLVRREPVAVLTLAIAGVNLMALPPSGGFLAKWLLLTAALRAGRWDLAVVLLVGSLLAAAYMFRIIGVTLAEGGDISAPPPIPATMRWAPLVLALLTFVFGLVTTEPIQLLEIGSPFGVGAGDR